MITDVSHTLIKDPAGEVTPPSAPHALVAAEPTAMLLTLLRS